MIRHSVILTLKSSLSPEDKTQYFDAVNELKQIPGVQKFEVLKQTSAKNPFEFGISTCNPTRCGSHGQDPRG